MVADGGSSGQKRKTPPLMALTAGGIAGGVEAACTYPFEFAKTRVQLYGHEGVRNPFRAVAKVAREEGVRALYKGCSTMVVGSIGKDAVRFVVFDHIRSLFAPDPTTGRLGTAQSIFAGMLTGVVASTAVVTPSERIKTALIDDARGGGGHARRFRSAPHCVAVLVREQGLRRALYSGYVTTTLKQVGTTGFRLGSYAALKDWERAALSSSSSSSSGAAAAHLDVDGPLLSFANGAAAGTLTTLATQPFDTIKTKAQQARAVRTADCVRQLLAEDGVRGLWRGTVMRLGRTVAAGGILFSANEQALRLLRAGRRGAGRG
ncbi:mitochondrial carrier [Durotheca rogersii]|uniref:mitochondrial carrier n=1 Tax=Durotheca rogersii TaxID=419775 RepID=UPI002220E06A|nr:mitochondrial carrier [Durotheca rogersii]KAI5865453.1 mitochondrial carrier [Durotheca rogersii]